jgi:hypothetical protein
MLLSELEGTVSMLSCSGVTQENNLVRAHIPEIGFCAEKTRLLDEFLDAIHEMNAIQSQQTQAVIDGDGDFARFDVLLHLAQNKKERAKYAWMAHVQEHHCHDGGID